MPRPAVPARPFDPMVFWISAGVTIAFILGAILFPGRMTTAVNAVFTWTTTMWTWLYLLTVFFLVMGCFVLMGPAYGAIRLGMPGDRPEFSNFSWFAILFGSAIATGFVALQLSAGLKYQYGLELGPSSTYIIIGVLTAIFTLSVYTGLQKGVKLIGDVNMWVFVAVWFFVLVFGPTIFLVNLTVNALGQYLLHFIPMSLFTAPGYEGNWIGSWTVFYWAWWMSWAPFVAVFIATFFLTSANSAAISLAMFVSGHENPGRNLRAFWGVALGAVAAVLAGSGSLKAIQTASIATAFPLMFLLLVAMFGLFKGLNQHRKPMTHNRQNQPTGPLGP